LIFTAPHLGGRDVGCCGNDQIGVEGAGVENISDGRAEGRRKCPGNFFDAFAVRAANDVPISSLRRSDGRRARALAISLPTTSSTGRFDSQPIDRAIAYFPRSME
jgi:hypothetical protein